MLILVYRTEANCLVNSFTTVLKTVPVLVWEADVFLISGAALSMVPTPVPSGELGQMSTLKALTGMDCNLCNTGINH